jgi:predicted AlkP superfamily pyrophosphatase or phosphodiesterase
MKKLAFVLSWALAASGQAQAPSPVSPAAAVTSPKPRLVVVIAVDQMRFDYLERFQPLFKGGLKTLLERGASFTNARYRHANCETGPGHSVILSGRNAWHSGIIANGWFDAALGRAVNVVDDVVTQPLGGAGRGASPAHFVGFTLGDMLKKVSPEAKVVGVALKDRAAVLMAGTRADAAYWYEAGEGRFITSSYYMKAPPPWLDALNARDLPSVYAAKGWTKLLTEESVYTQFAGEDAVATEGDLKNITFPHGPVGAPGSPAFHDGFRFTPFADSLTLDMALSAMTEHGLGVDETPDVLAVGFSATDYIGHAYGPESHEIMDQLLRLDLVIARLIDAVEARVGRDRAVFVLSADHGVMPLVESLQKRGIAAKRVIPAELRAAVTAALTGRFPGKQDLVANAAASDLYLNLDAIARHGLRRADVEKTIGDALLATGVVAKIYTASSFAGEAPSEAEDPYFDAVRRSYFGPRSPHVIARLKEYMYLTSSRGGTGHGSPYDYDSHVPLVFMGGGIRPGTYAGDTGPEDIAPTLGALLGLDYPLQDARRLLTEMLHR